jgi:hypothetical protein
VDDSGKVFSDVHLADGVEVEVIAWRPRVAGLAHYRVRVPPNGADGWLPITNLRTALVPLPVPESPAAQAKPITDDGGKRFGQWPHTEAARAATTATATSTPGGGRRFGQHIEAETPTASPAPIRPEPALDAGRRRFGQSS